MQSLGLATPPATAPPSRAKGTETSARPVYVEHPMLTLERIEWQDERAKLRLYNALWASVVAHFVLGIGAYFLVPKLIALDEARTEAMARAPGHTLQGHELTFLELPKTPVAEPPKDSSIISDQNRRASAPRLDPKKLRELLDSTMAKPGAPGMNV